MKAVGWHLLNQAGVETLPWAVMVSHHSTDTRKLNVYICSLTTNVVIQQGVAKMCHICINIKYIVCVKKQERPSCVL